MEFRKLFINFFDKTIQFCAGFLQRLSNYKQDLFKRQKERMCKFS